MSNVRVSVIVPTYNRADLLPRALDSILSQTVNPHQVIVVDDGSTDETKDAVSKGYPCVEYIRQANKGVSAARNLGIGKSTGDWVAFLDSDDEWLPAKLEIQSRRFQDDVMLVHSDEIWIRNGVRVNAMNKHRKSGGDLYERCLPMCVISPSAAVIRRSLFECVGLFDESLPACEDYDLWLRICSRFPVAYVDQPLIRKYGGHTDQLSRAHWGMDRFRVRALVKMLDSGLINDRQRQATLAMLQRKLEILTDGARKRGNESLLAEMEVLRNRYLGN